MLVITNVTLIDVISGVRQAPITVVANSGEIVAVGQGLAIPPDAVRIDGRGKFLIPGLWDMHSHHQASGTASLDLFISNGVVGTRDMGSDLDFIVPLRDHIRQGTLLGPEIVAAGPMLDNAPRGWPARRRIPACGWPLIGAYCAHQARVAVRELKNSGVDFIKVHDRTARDAFFAIADEASALGLTFAGHVPNSVTVEEAVASGLKSIEHFANFRVFTECSGGVSYVDSDRCRSRFDALAAQGVWQTPTMAFYQTLPNLLSGRPLPHSEYASDALIDFMRGNLEASNADEQTVLFLRGMVRTALVALRDMHARGNRMLAGCDGLVPGFCLHDELEWMNEAGLSPLEAIQTATINPARFLGRENSQGTIEVGKRADMVLLEADPLADIRNTRRIAAVVVRGRIFSERDIALMNAAHRRTARNQ